jgi:hypothetical protein
VPPVIPARRFGASKDPHRQRETIGTFLSYSNRQVRTPTPSYATQQRLLLRIDSLFVAGDKPVQFDTVERSKWPFGAFLSANKDRLVPVDMTFFYCDSKGVGEL